MSDKWKSAFDQIHAEDGLKERTKEYLSKKVYGRRMSFSPLFRRVVPAAAGLVILLFIGGSYIFLTPTAYISIDINPSLELGINRFDRIVFVECYNEDGENLAETLNITFMNYNDALEEILSSQTIEDYLEQDAVLSLTVAGDIETQYSEIFETVETCASDHENIHCHSGDTEEMNEAHDAGVSFGKYRAYLMLKELDSSVSLDDIRDLTMREIYNLIDAYSESTGSGDDTVGTYSDDTDHGTDSRHSEDQDVNRHSGHDEGETD